jgi:hypothetical protein
MKEFNKQYRENNKGKLQNYRYFYNKNRRETDTLFNLKNSVSHRLREFLKVKNISFGFLDLFANANPSLNFISFEGWSS